MKVLQSCPSIGIQEYEAIKDVFISGWFTEGPKSEEFENKIKEMIGVKYGVLAPNGTLALYLGLKAIGVGPGDYVIVPNHTFFASATSVIMAGAMPLFVDVDSNNFQIDIEKCEKIINKYSGFVKAIMPVHLYGYCCNMSDVLAFSKKHCLKVIEDAAQALNISWDGKKAGSFGDVGCVSFFADKILTTIEGGFVSTNNKATFKTLQYLKNQGRLLRGSFQHPEIGYNFRLNDIQSTIGLVQLKKFNTFIKRRLEIYEMYKNYLKDVKQVRLVSPPSMSSFIPFRSIIICENGSQDLMNFMKLNEIETRSLFYPLHNQPAFKKLKKQYEYKDEDFSNSIKAFENGICLPCFPDLLDEQVKYVCDVIKQYYNV